MESNKRLRLVGGLLVSALELLAEEMPEEKSGDVHVLHVKDRGTMRSASKQKRTYKVKKRDKMSAAVRRNMSIAAKNRVKRLKQRKQRRQQPSTVGTESQPKAA